MSVLTLIIILVMLGVAGYLVNSKLPINATFKTIINGGAGCGRADSVSGCVRSVGQRAGRESA